jgi:hypothetical protein
MSSIARVYYFPAQVAAVLAFVQERRMFLTSKLQSGEVLNISQPPKVHALSLKHYTQPIAAGRRDWSL